jgi:hypothetical protein
MAKNDKKKAVSKKPIIDTEENPSVLKSHVNKDGISIPDSKNEEE